MFRRKTALLVVITLIGSLLAPVGGGWVGTIEAASNKYLHLNFDDYPAEPSLMNPTSTSDGGGSWSFFGTVAGSVYGIGETVPGVEGRSMSIVSNIPPNQSVNNPNIQKNNLTIPGSGGATSVIVMEGRFKFDNTALERRLFTATLTQSPNTTTIGEIRVTMDKTGKILLLYPSSSGANATEQLGMYEGGVWYHIQLYADMASRELKAYVNGELRASVAASSGWDNFRSFRFTQLGSAVTEGVMTMDDIKVYDWIPVEALSVDRSALNMVPGDRAELKAAYSPADSTNRYTTWESDHPEVATVDDRGVVSAVAAGAAVITARSKENGAIAAASVVTVSEYTAVGSVAVVPASLQLETERTAALAATIIPAQATNQEMIWSSDNKAVANVNVNGIVTAVSTGTAVITATSVDGPSAQSVVTVVERNTPIESIMLPPSARVDVGDTITVTPRYLPEDATNPVFQWASDNEESASVDSNGNITGLAPGSAIITASITGLAGTVAAEIKVEVTEAAVPADAFDELRLKWKAVLDGGHELDVEEPVIVAQIASINDLARTRWETMLRGEGRTSLWTDVPPSVTDSSFINTYMTRLRDMAYAYSTKGGSLYHNITMKQDIISALDWIYEHEYNEHIEEYGNWWNFDIGVPLRVMDIMVILYDDLSEEQIDRYVRAADKFIGDIMGPEFVQIGANRSDIMTIETLMGILTKDPDRLNDVLVQTSPLFDYVAEGDGFYKDDSFIQHKTIPYTGSYGEVLIRGLGQLLYLLDESPWEVMDADVANVYSWLFDSVAPVVYRGEMMDMVRGRAIAREALSGHVATIGMISGMLRLAMSAPEKEALRIRGLIKHWVLSTDPDLDVYSALKLDLIAPLENIMEDDSIAPQGDSPFHKEFGAMNRTVHVADGFALGISKSSNRIATYELTNGENGEGWYTGDGMTYLYNGDAKQYSDDYWPTVNRYRLPGTTVDTRPRTNDHYQYGDGETTPDNTWAGGATLGTDGVSGMNLQQVGTTLRANKSWFMFDDVIVALGSGISSSDGRVIETIVEQRKIGDDGANALIVDGDAAPANLGWTNTLTGVDWANLEGNMPGSDIGYYFPDSATLHASRTANSGSWYDINRNASTSADIRTRNYVSLWFDHGTNPMNETYSYVLLPNRTAAETASFAESPTISIVENSDAAHAVRDLSRNQTGINFWQNRTTTSAGVTSSRQASVLLKENADATLDLALSDPSFVNSGVIELEIDRSAASVLSADEEVTVTQLHPTIKLLVSVEGSFSRSFHASFDLDPAKERPDAEEGIPPIENVKESTGAEQPIAHLHSFFDQEQPGNRPVGLSIEEDPLTLGIVSAMDSDTDHVLQLMDRNPDGAVTVTGRFEEQAGNLEHSWTYADPIGNSGLRFRMIGEDQIAAELAAKPDGLYRVDASGEEQLLFVTEPAHWYTIHIRLDAERQEWMLYVNGERVPGIYRFIADVDVVDGIQFQTGWHNENVVAYLDDITVYVTGAVKLAADDFESYEAGALPGDWIITQRDSAPVYVWYDQEERNRSVLLDDNDSAFRATVSRTFEPQTGRLIAEWSYKELAGGKYPEFQLLSGGTRAVRLTSSSNNYLRYFGTNASANTIIAKASTKLKKWHAVKLDIDIPNHSYDIYFDGVLAEAGVPFFTDVDSIDTILFGSGYGAADAKLFVDNVKVYHLAGDVPAWETDGGEGGQEPSPTPTPTSTPTPTPTATPTPTSTPTPTPIPTSTPTPTATPTSTSTPMPTPTSTPTPTPIPTSTPTPTPTSSPSLPSEESGGEAGADGGTITAEKLLELLQAGTSIWTVKADGVSFEVPISALRIEFDQLAERLNLELANISFSVSMNREGSREDINFAGAIGSAGLPTLTEITDLQLMVRAGNKNYELSEFGNTYAAITIELNDSVDLSKAIAVMYDSQSGDIRFVPARFEEEGGVKRAMISSVYTGQFAIVEKQEITFEDIKGHWAKADIDRLASRLLIQGKSESFFQPEAAITRAEFITLLVRSLGLKEMAGATSFADVSAGAWYEGWLGAAVAAGLAEGYADGSFRPDATVSREEMSVLLARAMSCAGFTMSATGDDTSLLEGFSDGDTIASWARSHTAELTRLHILRGMDGERFAPKASMTRAQAAAVVGRMLAAVRFL